jgi:cytochrome c oxidase subunit 2
MHIHRFERIWMGFGVAMLAVFLVLLGIAAFADNINPPNGFQAIDPTKVAHTAPFDHPGLHQTGPNTYEAYYVAQIFQFTPSDLRIPAGSTVTFYVTSPDVLHGFFITNTDVNMEIVPGWVNTQTHTFKTPGTYLLICHEYCGIGHQNMYGRIEVQ